jgi:hypothetical protein
MERSSRFGKRQGKGADVHKRIDDAVSAPLPRMLKMAVQQGRSRGKTGSVPSGYVEDFSEARTLLAATFSILLFIAAMNLRRRCRRLHRRQRLQYRITVG